MPITIEYGMVVDTQRETVDTALRSMGKHELADKLPPAGRRVMADIAWLIREAAIAFDDGRPLDGLTAAERALEPKWESEAASETAYGKSAEPALPLAGGGGW